MTKKFSISLLFLITFIILLCVSNKVSAFEFDYDGKTYNTNELNLYKYTLVYYKNEWKEIEVVSCENPLTVVGDEKSDGFYQLSADSENGLINLYHLKPSSGTWQSDGSVSGIAFNTKQGEILYLDHDICNESGKVIFANTIKPDTFFNFRFGTLDYSINISANHIRLWQYIAIFKADNYLFIYTSKQRPTYKYSNYKHFLHTEDSTNTYLYDLKTDSVNLVSDLTNYYSSGADISFDKSQLIYSNFYLCDERMNAIFGTTGDYLGEEDMKGTASGNIASGGRSSEGNSALSDYINSQKPDYNGSSNQGSDTISGGFNNVYGNFGFAEDVKKNVNGMISVITNTSEAPKFQINVNSKYYKGTLTIVDLSWYAPYKEIGDNVICIFAYLGFLWRIFIRLPDIIRGVGADSYAGDMGYEIGLWNKYGMGRSSSPRSITERKQSLSAYVFKRR